MNALIDDECGVQDLAGCEMGKLEQLTVRVTAKTMEAQDIASFELVSVDGQPLPPFSAGSHIDVHMENGLVRQYSLCNDPAETRRYLIAVLREPNSRGGSSAMHEQVGLGSVLQISQPRNHFPLVAAPRSLLLAGGIGVTPILCMAERLQRLGADFEMRYCTRAPERTAFRSRIAQSGFADKVQFHFDAGPAQQKLDCHALLAAAEAGTHLYVCGPAGFIQHVADTAQALGWPRERVHFEYFGAPPQDSAADAGFQVRLASSGKTYEIPADKTVIEILAANGIQIPTSCEQGVCGTCVTRVISGQLEHRDVYLNDAEHAGNQQFTPCCSRAKGLLVLDL